MVAEGACKLCSLEVIFGRLLRNVANLVVHWSDNWRAIFVLGVKAVQVSVLILVIVQQDLQVVVHQTLLVLIVADQSSFLDR